MKAIWLARLLGYLYAGVLVLAAGPAWAGSSASGVKVINVEANKGYGSGGLVFIKLSVPPTGKPTCSNHYWDYTLALSTPFDDKMYALLLAALTTGGTVDITGLGACSDQSSMESLRSVGLTP